MKARTLLPLALLSLLLLTACNTGTPLPGGYAIFFGDSEDVGLVLPPKGEILVGPKLAKIGSSGTLIFGEVQPPKKPNPSLAGSRTPGFFILDSSTGTIEKGLSREDWLKKLQKAGLQGEPELVYPERKGPRKGDQYDVKTYQGDGRMVDHGRSAASERFSLHLGEVDFAKEQTLRYKIGKLPPVELVAGFDIRDLPPVPAGGDNVHNDFNRASIHILLKTAEGETVFEETSPLSAWTWGYGMPGTERRAWMRERSGCRFTPQPEQQYVLTLKITPLAGSKAVKPAALRISGGGWKVE